LLGVVVLEERLQLLLVFVKLGEAILKNVLRNLYFGVSELLKQVFVLLIILLIAFVLLDLAHLVLVLFVRGFTVLLINEFVVDVLKLL